MDELELKGAVYVGHSMAGMIGCIASVGRPDLFSHLVLVGASPRSRSHIRTLTFYITRFFT
jgi:pimeloyl-ACP methyl ester carboxylesterase